MTVKQKTDLQKTILQYIYENTLPQAINIAVAGYKFHSLYRNRKNHIIHTYFNGDVLRFSVFMADLFNQYITEGQEIRREALENSQRELKRTIKWKKKYREDYGADVIEHNLIVDECREIMKGVNRFIKGYNSYRKGMYKK